MKKRLSAGILLMFVTLIPIAPQTQQEPSQEASPPVGDVSTPQEFRARKPKDYMSSFFSRDTKPLGLKEDQALKSLLRQRSIKWANRTGIRHILD